MLTDANQSRVGAKSYLRKYVRACRIIDNRQLPRSLEWSAGDFASMARVNIHKLSGGAHVSLSRTVAAHLCSELTHSPSYTFMFRS